MIRTAGCRGPEMASVQYRLDHVGDGIKIVSPNLFTPIDSTQYPWSKRNDTKYDIRLSEHRFDTRPSGRYPDSVMRNATCGRRSFILPYIDYTHLRAPANITNLPGLVSGVVTMVGLFGLISGIIVLVSAVMLRAYPSQRRTWGVLMLVFSVLSFLGLGGFVVGAILGIAGAIMTLRWNPPIQ